MFAENFMINCHRKINLLYFTCFATNIATSIPCGYHLSVVNAPAELIKDWCKQTFLRRYGILVSPDILELLLAITVAIFLFGGIFGALSGSLLADKYGRKSPILTMSICYLFGGIFFTFCRMADSFEMLILGRFLSGIASGLTTSVVPMYLAELSPLRYRGSTATLVGMSIVFGVFIGQVFSLPQTFGTDNLWHYALAFHCIFTLIGLIAYPWYPESPIFLFVIAKDEKKALCELTKLRPEMDNSVQNELLLMKNEALNHLRKRSIWSVFTDKTMMLPIFLVVILQGGQQLCGINVVFFYSVSIFEKAGLNNENSNWANLGLGVISILTASFSPYIMAKLNRRFVVITSATFCGIFLVLFMIILHFVDRAHCLPFASVATIFAYTVSFEFGLGSIPYFIASELCESPTRPAVMAIGSFTQWTTNFISGLVFPSLQLLWGYLVFAPFAITCLVVVIVVYIYLPETRFREPSDVSPLMMNGFKLRPVNIQRRLAE